MQTVRSLAEFSDIVRVLFDLYDTKYRALITIEEPWPTAIVMQHLGTAPTFGQSDIDKLPPVACPVVFETYISECDKLNRKAIRTLMKVIVGKGKVPQSAKMEECSDSEKKLKKVVVHFAGGDFRSLRQELKSHGESDTEIDNDEKSHYGPILRLRNILKLQVGDDEVGGDAFKGSGGKKNIDRVWKAVQGTRLYEIKAEGENCNADSAGPKSASEVTVELKDGPTALSKSDSDSGTDFDETQKSAKSIADESPKSIADESPKSAISAVDESPKSIADESPKSAISAVDESPKSIADESPKSAISAVDESPKSAISSVDESQTPVGLEESPKST